MTITNDIRAALEQQLDNVTGIPSASNRAYENQRFSPTTGTPWVRVLILPLDTRPAHVGPSPQQRYDGIFRVDIFEPTERGPAAAETLADNVRAAYTVDDVLTSGQASVRFMWAERQQGQLEGAWFYVPVNVRWYAYN